MKTPVSVLIVAGTAFIGVWCIARVALKITGVPAGFPPFTTLPLLSGVVGGFLGASAMYALCVRASASHPDRLFFLIAIGILALSFALPIRLSFTHSRRFAGVTPAAQMTLALLHTVIATSAVAVLTRTGASSR